METQTLETLAMDLAVAKREESEAKTRRVELEGRIAELVETADRGSRTVEAAPGLKVTVKRGMNYKADIDGIMRAVDRGEIPDGFSALKSIPASYKLDESQYEKLLTERPDIGARIARFVTATPAKVSVTLKIG